MNTTFVPLNFERPERPIYKSPNTKPLADGFCNTPINWTEVAREIVDRLKGDMSRNMFLTKVIVQGLAQEFPEAAEELKIELKKAGRLLGLILVTWSISWVLFSSVNKQEETFRTARVVRPGVRVTNRSKDETEVA